MFSLFSRPKECPISIEPAKKNERMPLCMPETYYSRLNCFLFTMLCDGSLVEPYIESDINIILHVYTHHTIHARFPL